MRFLSNKQFQRFFDNLDCLLDKIVQNGIVGYGTVRCRGDGCVTVG